jgi:hypothetical protein
VLLLLDLLHRRRYEIRTATQAGPIYAHAGHKPAAVGTAANRTCNFVMLVFLRSSGSLLATARCRFCEGLHCTRTLQEYPGCDRFQIAPCEQSNIHETPQQDLELACAALVRVPLPIAFFGSLCATSDRGPPGCAINYDLTGLATMFEIMDYAPDVCNIQARGSRAVCMRGYFSKSKRSRDFI